MGTQSIIRYNIQTWIMNDKWIVVLTLALIALSSSSTYQQLNYELEILHDDFIDDFVAYYTAERIENMTREQKGNYLFLLGKMYLYDVVPTHLTTQSPYILGYHYIKIAAEQYEYRQAYYYLAILQYMKFSPSAIIKTNLQPNPSVKNFLNAMNTSHLHQIQHNLYLASVLGHKGASLTLGYMLKEGIGMDKNCSSSLSYYLYSVKEQKVNIFEFPSEYSDDDNFEKHLYARKKVDFKHYGQDDISPLLQTDFFDDESIRAYEEIARNYFRGENGFLRDHKKAFQIYERIAEAGSKAAKLSLAHFYLRGQGTEVNYEKARKNFESISSNSKHAQQYLIVMKYFSLSFKDKRQTALKQMQQKFDEYEKKIQTYNRYEVFTTPYIKFLVSTLIIAGELKGSKDSAVRLMEEAVGHGNVMAMTALGLMLADGSDISFDCKKAVNYFSNEAFSRYIFQEKIQISKIGLKKNKLMFTLIKYFQLIMIGYDNAFVNSFYLLEVYGNQDIKLDENSWSLKQANKNQHYKFLHKLKYIPTIERTLMDNYNTKNQKVLKLNNLNELTMSGQKSRSEFFGYLKTKILTLGIKVNKLGLLKFYKYKNEMKNDLEEAERKKEESPTSRLLTKYLATLTQMANQNGKNSYILQSRFLVGKYYQHAAQKQPMENRIKTALQQYTRATKSSFFAYIIFFIEGGSFPDSHFFNDLIMYLTLVMIVGFFLYWKKSKRIEEILIEQGKRMEEKEKRQKQEMIEKQKQEEEGRIRKQNEEGRMRMRKEEEKDPNQPQIIEDY